MPRVLIATNPTFPYTDTPPAGGPYYYQVEVIDASGYVVSSSDVVSNETPIAGFTPAAVDFMAAVVATLQQNSACASAFGDSATTPKFQGILAFRGVQLPFCRLLEMPADDVFQSMDGNGITRYFERGELQADVFAVGEASARNLGKLVAAALNDAALNFADGTCLEILQSRQFFLPEPDAGDGTAAVYHRVILFRYLNQRNL